MSDMNDTDTFREVPPDPARIIEGLRDTGYEFKTAIADLIDNSIAAQAGRIDIRIAMDFGGNVLLSIADDGCGMDREGLVNAMRYGSTRRSDPSSLGKFGLGLKTASTAFCRRLSAISRGVAGGEVLKATWDLDHIASAGAWQLGLATASSDEIMILDNVAHGSTGTLVLWENVDRLLKAYNPPDSPAAQKALRRYIEDLRLHVSMVYQRFLDSGISGSLGVCISINDTVVRSWDPFCIKESGVPVAEKRIKIEIEGKEGAEFLIRAFILPRKDEFKDPVAFRESRLSNDMQGIYVYRENRLIHGPDWLGMFEKEPHLTLCRVELSFDHRLDDAFQVDIKKSRILLDESIYDWMSKFLQGPRRTASERYRRGLAAVASGASVLLHGASNSAIHAKADTLATARVTAVDGTSGNVTVQNKNGITKLKIKLVEEKRSGECHIQPVDSINDGLLWEPTFIGENEAVRINTGHAYYSKVYLPNRKSGVTIQGLDSLIWALCVAELGNVNEANKRSFEEMRFEISRILRLLVEDLPDPENEES